LLCNTLFVVYRFIVQAMGQISPLYLATLMVITWRQRVSDIFNEVHTVHSIPLRRRVNSRLSISLYEMVIMLNVAMPMGRAWFRAGR
jgi:hypothetical protein